MGLLQGSEVWERVGKELHYNTQPLRLLLATFTGKNGKTFLIFGNSEKIWVLVFHLRRFKEVVPIFRRLGPLPAIDRGRSQHICASFRTIQRIPGSLVWP